MKKGLLFCLFVCFIGFPVQAQELDIEDWPPQTDFSEEIHYWSGGDFLTEKIPAGEGDWVDASLTILTGGDQATSDVTIAGKEAKKAEMIYMNVADELFFVWPDFEEVDVLVQYFANAESKRDDFGFLIGQLGNQVGVGGYSFESVTDEFEWRLFRIDNSEGRLGNQTDSSQSGTEFGGVNGGTLRFERVESVIFRAIAIAPAGTFGDPEDINQARTVEFNPDDYAHMAEWDIHNEVVNGIDLYRDESSDQETLIEDNIGPEDDKRTAARAAFQDGSDDTEDIYMNWEILDEHFGPTSQPSVRYKIVAEYYDDPEHTGALFGPEAYKTTGDQIAFFPEEKRTELSGTGKWMEAEWYVTDVKLFGVNVPTQAAARFHFEAPVYISRMRLGVIRTSGNYEGLDPIPDSYPFDPDPYGIYAELDLDKEITDNLDMGNNGGDQEYFIEEGIGPEGDKRRAVRPALDEGAGANDIYMNFAILNEVFGPSDQPNAVFKVSVDYYDDPALEGEMFGPEVYQTKVFGSLQFNWYPQDQRATIEGTDTWRTATWQIDNMNFTGVNVDPQGAARFWFSDEAAVYISRVRYAVIRPVGEHAGVDRLEDEPLTKVRNWEVY